MSRGFRDDVDEETFEVPEATVTAETEKAIRVRSRYLDDGEAWVPQSQVSDESEVWAKGDTGTLVVTTWFARQRGWLDD